MRSPWFVRFALLLSLLLPIYFVVAALGTKFGAWGWRTGLGTMVGQAGPWLIGGTAIIALVAFAMSIVRRPRGGWRLALVALAIPLAIFAGLSVVRARSNTIPPIHDVATDTATPPQFSPALLAKRTAAGANPIQSYTAPLGTLEPWQGERFAALASLSHADIIRKNYPDLTPIPLGNVATGTALDRVADSMREMGFESVAVDRDKAIAEGTAETFWYGFKDDVVVRVADGRIDIRSVSRVGLSDLGANAARIEDLQDRIRSRLAQ